MATDTPRDHRPRALDLFAGGQGAAVGYARAGFEVHAVDIAPHALHPEIASFTTADAFEVLADVDYCRSFDIITASPPCQDHSVLLAVSGGTGTGWMLRATLEALTVIGRPYVVENVGSARALRGELMLCGTMFGLGAMCADGVHRQLRRHRLFASDVFLVPPGPCRHAGRGRSSVHGGGTRHPTISVVGQGPNRPRTGARRGWQASKSEAVEAMGIDWMVRTDLSQAIPPAYTQWIGAQMIDQLHDHVEARRALEAGQ